MSAELATFLSRARERSRGVPRFVERELRAYLGCGVLTHGFLRARCDACGCESSPRRARRKRGLRRGQCGAVAFVQRFGDALNLNVHFHPLVLDGVYGANPDGLVRFRPLPPPDDAEVAEAHSNGGQRDYTSLGSERMDVSREITADKRAGEEVQITWRKTPLAWRLSS